MTFELATISVKTSIHPTIATLPVLPHSSLLCTALFSFVVLQSAWQATAPHRQKFSSVNVYLIQLKETWT